MPERITANDLRRLIEDKAAFERIDTRPPDTFEIDGGCEMRNANLHPQIDSLRYQHGIESA